MATLQRSRVWTLADSQNLPSSKPQTYYIMSVLETAGQMIMIENFAVFFWALQSSENSLFSYFGLDGGGSPSRYKILVFLLLLYH